MFLEVTKRHDFVMTYVGNHTINMTFVMLFLIGNNFIYIIYIYIYIYIIHICCCCGVVVFCVVFYFYFLGGCIFR